MAATSTAPLLSAATGKLDGGGTVVRESTAVAHAHVQLAAGAHRQPPTLQSHLMALATDVAGACAPIYSIYAAFKPTVDKQVAAGNRDAITVAMEVCIIAVPILWMYAIVTAITGNIAKSRLYHRLLDGGVVMTFRRRHPMRSRMLAFLVLAGAALAAVVWQWSHSASSNRDVFSNTSIVMAQAFVLCSFYVNRVLYAEDRLTTVNSWVSGRTTRSAGDALAELRSCSELDAVVAYRVLYGQAKEAVHASGKRGCCAYSAVRVDLRDVGQLAADLADGKESDDSRKAALSLRSCCWRMYGTYTIPIAMLNCSPLKDDRTLGMVLQAGQSCTYGILLMLQFLAALRSG